MSFHLTFAQVLAVNWGIWVTAGLGLVMIVIAVLTWRRPSRSASPASAYSPQMAGTAITRRINPAPFLGAVGVMLIALAAWFAYSGIGTGWSLANGTLSVQTGFGDARIPINQTQSEWVSPTGPYGLALRTNGISAGTFQAGHFMTHNRQSVLVFHYGSGNRWLLVQDGRTQLLISSPNVEALAAYLPTHSPAQIVPAQLPRSTSSALYVRLAAGIVAGLAFVAIQIGMAKRAAPRLPERMVTHWGVDGQPNGWMKKQTALRVMPGIAAVMAVVGVAVSLVAYTPLVIFTFVQLVILGATGFMYRANMMKS